MKMLLTLARRAAQGIAVLVCLFALLLAERLSWLPRSLAPLSGEIAAAEGLEGAAEIIRDRNAVPHIFAQSAPDGLFALGFVHAQDRLWQMAMTRRLLQGRLAELAGPIGVTPDTLARTLDIEGRARSSFDALSPEAQAALVAYAAGVNQWADGNAAHLPPEFHLTISGFEPWEPHHSLMLLKFLSLMLSGNAPEELQRLRLAEALGAERAGELLPAYPDAEPVAVRDALGNERRAQGATPDPLLDAFVRLGAASNNWVVDGRYTKTGKPLLANDPHLGFSAPGMWYLAHLSLADGDIAGATIPGIPAVLLGHNGRMAWGFTTTHADTADLVFEKLLTGDPGRYETPDGALAFQVREARIKVRLGGTRTIEVRESRHGPVVPPFMKAIEESVPEGRVLALATPALERRDRSYETAVAIMVDRDPGAIERAFLPYVGPIQSVVYADTDGDIGLIVPGLIPMRPNPQERSLLPVAGETANPLWSGYIPFEELPRLQNPPRGQIVTANNRIVDETYPHLIAGSWPPPYRARRIGELLSSGAPWDAEDFLRMQMDGASPFAQDILPSLLRTKPTGDRERVALEILAAWDGHMRKESAAPLIFTAWTHAFQRMITSDDLGDLKSEVRAVNPLFLTFVLSGDPRAEGWCDDQGTDEIETCAGLVAGALTRALDEIAARHGDDMTAWRWGKAHEARFNHQAFGSVPLIGEWFNRRIETGGGPLSVDRGEVPYRGKDPYRSVHGAGLRAVYDLSDLGASRFMIAPGQSGNPLSPYYDHFLKAWADGESIHLPLERSEIEAGAIGIWRLGAAQSASER